jgi:hypothetical protein
MKVQKITLNDNSYDNKKELIERYQSVLPPALLSIDAEWDWPCASNTPVISLCCAGALPNNK